jgi:pilus assembly protein Flp/PilA
MFGARNKRMKIFRRFRADETAATAIEYGLIAAGIALAIIAVVNGIGAKLNTKFSSINSSLK